MRARPVLALAAALIALVGCSSVRASQPARMLASIDSDTDALASVDSQDPYDPWMRFNEKMFDFNWKLDQHVLKPVAKGYRTVLPEQLQIMISNGFDNIRFVPRFINSVLQGKWDGAMRELGRFLVNSTVGVGGLFDVGTAAGIKPSKEDFGQTLATWGAGSGAYLVLPFMDPMTVRDGIGRGVDSALDPLAYVLPLLPVRIAMRGGDTVNERALNYDMFQGVEESTVDLYSSVRHYYIERRRVQVGE